MTPEELDENFSGVRKDVHGGILGSVLASAGIPPSLAGIKAMPIPEDVLALEAEVRKSEPMAALYVALVEQLRLVVSGKLREAFKELKPELIEIFVSIADRMRKNILAKHPGITKEVTTAVQEYTEQTRSGNLFVELSQVPAITQYFSAAAKLGIRDQVLHAWELFQYDLTAELQVAVKKVILSRKDFLAEQLDIGASLLVREFPQIQSRVIKAVQAVNRMVQAQTQRL